MGWKISTARFWITIVLLLGASAWCFNLAMFNWFAADQHDRFSRTYALRGNVFSVLAFVLFAVFVWAVISAIRSHKRRSCA